MKIRRIINGVPVDIELTKTEEFDIFLAKQQELDMDDVRNNDLFASLDYVDGVELLTEEEWERDGVPAVAKAYRAAIDNDNWFALLVNCAEGVAEEMIRAKREKAVSA